MRETTGFRKKNCLSFSSLESKFYVDEKDNGEADEINF